MIMPKMAYHEYVTGSQPANLMCWLTGSGEEGRRVLVFSQFTTMLDIIKEELEHNNIAYKMLDGRTPQKDRGQGDY